MLTEIDNLEIHVLVNDELDPIAPSMNPAVKVASQFMGIPLSPLPAGTQRDGATMEMRMDNICCAAHGLSLLLVCFTSLPSIPTESCQLTRKQCRLTKKQPDRNKGRQKAYPSLRRRSRRRSLGTEFAPSALRSRSNRAYRAVALPSRSLWYASIRSLSQIRQEKS